MMARTTTFSPVFSAGWRLVLLAAGIFALAGCGPAVDTDAVQLTFWSKPWWGDPMQYQDPDGDPVPAIEWQKARIAEFEKRFPGVRIRREIDPGGDKLRLAFASGTAPDVFFTGVDGEVMRFAEMGFIEPIDAFLRPEDEADTWKSVLDAGRVGDRRYLWPLYNHALVILVNQSLCEEQGVSHLLPTEDESWDVAAFLELARALTIDRNHDGRPEVYGVGIPANGEIHYLLTTYLLNFDARIFDEHRGFVFNSEHTREAVDFLLGMVAADGVAPPGAAGYRFTDIRDLFFAQKIGIMLGNAGLIDYGELQIRTGRIKPFTIRMTAVPTRDRDTPSTSFLSVGAVAVARQTDPARREAAMELARWLTGPELNGHFWSKWASPRKSTPLPEDPNLRTMMKLVARAENFMVPPVALHPRYDLPRQLDIFYQRIFTEKDAVEDALADFESKFNRDGLRGVDNWPSAP